MIEGFDIICISTSDWKSPWGSRQQIMTRLSEKNRVLFIEYQASFLHLLKYPKQFCRIFKPHLINVNKNLMVYRPLLNLPFRYYSTAINLLNQRLLLLQLRYLIRQLKFTKILLWTFEPTACAIIGKVREGISIYHCIDFFKNEKNIAIRKKCIENMEEGLCKSCNIVLVSTTRLLADKIAFNKETHLVPSAVDEFFFKIDNLFLSTPVLENLKKIKGVRIGFIGTLDDRIDLELIDFIANQHEDWAIILVGPVKNRGLGFLRKKNVYLPGYLNSSFIPSCISLFNICIIPYKVNEFTSGISPIKVFEYLSVGKPIVATELPSLRDLEIKNLLKIAKDKPEFVKQIESSLRNDGQEDKKIRIKFAKNNTWQHRVDSISEIINSYSRKLTSDSTFNHLHELS